MGWKILLPQELMPEGRALLQSHGHTLVSGSGFETEDIIRDIADCDAIIVRISKITREVFEAAPKLKALARHGAGFETVDLKAAEEFGVQCVYAPLANSTSVAETALLLMLYCSRNVSAVRRLWVEDYYQAKLKVRKNTLDGKTLGLIGCGNIGSRLARRALAMEMTVLAYDPYLPAKAFPAGVRVVRDLDEIFAESDYVSLHAPATEKTRGMVNAARLAQMKPTAFLINTARGALVDEQALYEACRDGVIAGAGLDAIAQEPVDPASPLLTLENVMILPHIGGNTVEAAHRASYMAAQGIEELYEGRTPTWPIRNVNWAEAKTYQDI